MEKDVETYFRTAKSVYKQSIKSLWVLTNRTYKLAQITGIAAAVVGGIFSFIPKQGAFLPSWPLLLVWCGLICLLMTVFLSLMLTSSGWRLPTRYLLDPKLVIRCYKKSNLSKEIVAENMLKCAYQNLIVRSPKIRKRISILQGLTTIGFILIIAGISWIILAFSF